MSSDEWDLVESLTKRDATEDKSDVLVRLKDREDLIKEAVDAAVQKVIDGLSVELDVDYSGLNVKIKMNDKEVASSWVSLVDIKYNLDF